MEPGQFVVVFAVLGTAVAGVAGLSAMRTRTQGEALARRAQDQNREVPPLVAAYFQWMARMLTFSASAFLALAVLDGLLAHLGQPELVQRAVGFCAAVALLACGSLQVMAGTVDMRLRLGPPWQRVMLGAGGLCGIALAAATMIQIVQQGRLWV